MDFHDMMSWRVEGVIGEEDVMLGSNCIHYSY